MSIATGSTAAGVPSSSHLHYTGHAIGRHQVKKACGGAYFQRTCRDLHTDDHFRGCKSVTGLMKHRSPASSGNFLSNERQSPIGKSTGGAMCRCGHVAQEETLYAKFSLLVLGEVSNPLTRGPREKVERRIVPREVSSKPQAHMS